MISEYKFSVLFEGKPSVIYYTIPIKGSEGYPDALIKLVRLASIDGKIVSIMKEKE